MYQGLARALRAISNVDPNALMQVAYQSLIAAVDAGLTNDTTDNSDLPMAISGLIADWLQTQQHGNYPDEAQRERILAVATLIVDGLWNHQFGRSVAEARARKKNVLLAMKAALASESDTRPPGRPSQGRSERIQAMVSEDVLAWLNNQRQPQETMSDVINHLLQGLMRGE